MLYRTGMLFRALPSILAELAALAWYGYRSGDRAAALAALVWLCSTLGLVAFAAHAVLAVLQGEEVQLRGPFLLASLPISMWLARELVSLLMLVAGWLIMLLGRDPVDVRG